VAGVALALFHKQRCGVGQLVDASLLRSGIWGMALPLIGAAQRLAATGEPVTSMPPPKVPARAGALYTFNCYECADEVWIQLLGLQVVRHLPALLKATGLDGDWDARTALTPTPDDPAGAVQRRVQLEAALDVAFAAKPVAEWETILKEHDVWYCRLANLHDVLGSPQAAAAQTFVEPPAGTPQGDSFRMLGSPMRLSAGEGHDPISEPPPLGKHTEQVLSEAGLTAAEVEAVLLEVRKG